MDDGLLHVDQAPLTTVERALLAMTVQAVAARAGYTFDLSDEAWLDEVCAGSVKPGPISAFSSSLRDGDEQWRSLLASAAAMAESLRPTLVATHALVNPFLGPEDPFPWMRLDACSDCLTGDVHGETIFSRFEVVLEALHEASPSPGLRRTVNGVGYALSALTGGFLGLHGLGGMGGKAGSLIGQASEAILGWLTEPGDEADDLATLVIIHAALPADGDTESAAELAVFVADMLMTTCREIESRSTNPSATAYEETRQFEHILRLSRVTAEWLSSQVEEMGAEVAPPLQVPALSGLSLPDARRVLALMGVQNVEVEDVSRQRSIWSEDNWDVVRVVPDQRKGGHVTGAQLLAQKRN